MIRRLYGYPTLSLPHDYFGAKTRAYLKAYGFGYEFCRFYGFAENGGGNILINNSNAIVSGTCPDMEEFGFFLAFEGISSIETAHIKNIAGYEKRKRYLLEKSTDRTENVPSDGIITRNGNFSDAYTVLESSFEAIEYELWYADTSHRIRHDISELFLYKDIAVGSVEFTADGYGFISDVAVKPEHRGKGYAALLLSRIEESLKERSLSARTYAYGDILPFYVRRGYRIIRTDTYFTLKGKNIHGRDI